MTENPKPNDDWGEYLAQRSPELERAYGQLDGGTAELFDRPLHHPLLGGPDDEQGTKVLIDGVERTLLHGLDFILAKHGREGHHATMEWQRRMSKNRAGTQRALDQDRKDAITHFSLTVANYLSKYEYTIRDASDNATMDYQTQHRRNYQKKCPAEIHFREILGALEMISSKIPLESITRYQLVLLNSYSDTKNHFQYLMNSYTNSSSSQDLAKIGAAKNAWEDVFKAWSKAKEYLPFM